MPILLRGGSALRHAKGESVDCVGSFNANALKLAILSLDDLTQITNVLGDASQSSAEKLHAKISSMAKTSGALLNETLTKKVSWTLKFIIKKNNHPPETETNTNTATYHFFEKLLRIAIVNKFQLKIFKITLNNEPNHA